jgi:hypothetical protein
MRKVSDKSCRKKSKHTFYVQKSFSENCAVCERMWKNTVERGMQQMAIQYDAEKM